MSKSSEAESAEITTGVSSSATENTSTVPEAEEADTTESYFTKYEKEESLPIYLKYLFLTEAMFVKLKER